MEWDIPDKVIVVEGLSDKRKVLSVLDEEVEVRCTNGTISLTKLDELVEELMEREVYLLFDADQSGDKLRRQFRRELPEASHLYIEKMYREVEDTPEHHIAHVVSTANMKVKAKFLNVKDGK